MTDIIDEEKRTAPTLTYSQARNRADEVHARMEQIGELDNPTDEENAEFRDLGVEFDSLVEHMGRLERAAELARVAKSAERIGKPATLKIDRSGVGTERGSDYDRDAILEPDSVEDCRFRNPWDLREVRTFGRGSAEVAGSYAPRTVGDREDGRRRRQGASGGDHDHRELRRQERFAGPSGAGHLQPRLSAGVVEDGTQPVPFADR